MPTRPRLLYTILHPISDRLTSTVASKLPADGCTHHALVFTQVLHRPFVQLGRRLSMAIPLRSSRHLPRYPWAPLQHPLGAKSAIQLERCIRNCVPACHEQYTKWGRALQQNLKDTPWLTSLRRYAAAPTWGPPLHYENTSEISSAELPYEVLTNLRLLDVVLVKETLPFSHGPSVRPLPSHIENSLHAWRTTER
jgi:hypothetical protein